MKQNAIAFLGILCFVGLSATGLPAEAQTVEQIAEVQRLKSQADQLLKLGEKSEAIERYKDCICLLELQKWDPDKKREFLQDASNVKPKKQVQSHFVGDDSAKYLFVTEILKSIHVKSARDLPLVNELLKSARIEGEKDELGQRLLDEVTALNATSAEEKRNQLDALQTIFQAMGNEGPYGPAQGKMKALALEIDPTKDDKLAAQQSRVLCVVLNSYSYPSRDGSSENNVDSLRDTIFECMALMERYPGKVQIDLSNGISKAMQFDKLASLVPLLEKYVALQTARYPEYPQHYQADRCNLAWVYLDAGRFQDAERLFKDISATCRKNRASLFDYEFSELSLARCYLMEKKFNNAKRCLNDLIAFLAGPSIADVNQYGAMAEGMLGEIAMNNRDWRTARIHLERADVRMPLLVNSYSIFQNISFIRNNIPSEATVLRDLAEVYAQLKLKTKSEEYSKLYASVKVVDDSQQGAINGHDEHRRLNLAFRKNIKAVNAAVKSYLPTLLASKADKANVFESLMSLIRRCEERGASAAGLMCVEEALKFDKNVTHGQSARLSVLQAQFLIQQRNFEEAREKLKALTSMDSNSANSSFIAKSLIADSYLREGNVAEAESCFKALFRKVDNGSQTTNNTSDDKLWFDTGDGAQHLFVYVQRAYCDFAELLVSKRQFAESEYCLKELVSGRSKLFGGKTETKGGGPLANVLLAYAESLQGKRSESELNLRTGLTRWRGEGVIAARMNRFAGLTYKELGDPDRGRRFLFDAFKEYDALMPKEDFELKSCRAELEEVTPGLKL